MPDDVNLVRTFEISAVRGNWSTLEIRKHRVRLVSDAITQAEYSDEVTLEMLADQHLALETSLNTLSQREAEEASLILEKRQIELQLAAYANLPNTRAEVERLRQRVRQLEQEVRNLQAAHTRERNNPLNFWCRLKNGLNPENGYDATCFFLSSTPHQCHCR